MAEVGGALLENHHQYKLAALISGQNWVRSALQGSEGVGKGRKQELACGNEVNEAAAAAT